MEQADLLRLLADTLERLEIPYAVVGSFASGVWGETRFTQDIDVLVDMKPAHIDPLYAAFPESDFYLSKVAMRDALTRRSQFNLIHPTSGNKIDFMISNQTPWASAQLSRRRQVSVFPDKEVSFAAPEDIILSKLVYYRDGGSDKHLRDIAGILKISGSNVDHTYVATFAKSLNVADIWQAHFDPDSSEI